MERRSPPPPKSGGQLLYEIWASLDTRNTHLSEWREVPPDDQQGIEGLFWKHINPLPPREQEDDADTLG